MPLSMVAPPMQGAPMPAQRPPMQPPVPQDHMNPATSGQLQTNTPPLTSEAAKIAEKDKVAPQEANDVANDAKNAALTPQQKQLLSFQMVANKKTVGEKMTNRALGAVTYEKVLGENQDKFAPAFENAAKYAGALGSGQLTLQKFQAEHPEQYADYMWVTTDLIPNFGQNVRVMEGLASTDNQREALAEMYKSSLNWKSDPKMAVRNINKTIDLFQSQAKATLETAQPVYPGVLEKLYGLNERKSDYLGPGRTSEKQSADLSKMSTDELLKMYREMK